MARLNVRLGDLELENPIIPASGTFGYGYEFADLYDIDILGSLAFKTTTLNKRFGNPTPRIAETASGMLNAIGLQNPGVDKVIEEELPKLKKCFHKPIVANISGFSIEEYQEVARRLDSEEQIGLFEVNVSCPNVSGGGIHFGSDPDMARQVTEAIKNVTTKPVFIKLSPNVTGGLSGPAIFPVALRMVYQVSRAVNIPIIGIGGVSSARDVIEMMMAGASAVEVGAANFADPYICKKIIEELPEVMDELGIENIRDIIGGCK